MSPAEALIAEARRLGVELTAHDGRLQVNAPVGVVTPGLRDGLRTHRNDLLAWLRPQFVLLNGGLALPLAALTLALDLADRGMPLATDSDHQLIVPDDERLTPADRAAIARWRHHLGAIIEYRAPDRPEP